MKVVAAIDNSAAAAPVLAMAQAVASALGADVEAVHVTEDGDETARTVATSSGAPLRTISGEPVEQLVSVIGEEDVVATVLGTRGNLGAVQHSGHLASALADRTDKPIVAVPPGARPPEQLSRVLVAMEGSPGKARSLQRTIDLSTNASLEIVVVHVDEEIPSFTDQVQYEAEAYTQEFFARHVIGAPKARLELRIGAPATEVLGAIEDLSAEIVAIGWPHTVDPARGTVAREILERSPVPVLLVAIT